MMQILALVPGAVSRQLLWFPALESLKRKYPDALIDVAAAPSAVSAYRVCKLVRQTLLFDFQAPNSLADWGNFLGQMRDRDYDLVLTFTQRWTDNFSLWLSGIPQRVGYANSPGALFLTQTVARGSTDLDLASSYHALLKGLDIQEPCPPLTINVPAKDLEWAEAEHKRLAIGNGGYVLLQGVSETGQVYPVEHWQVIIQDFHRRQPDLPLVLVQGSQDGTLVQSLFASYPFLKMTTPDSIGKLAALIAGASIMLCADQAAMSLAIAVKTYTIGILGRGGAQLFPKSEKFMGLEASNGNLATISPALILKTAWNEN
jgi:ADP-heptose:LPS heptosyltransferase